MINLHDIDTDRESHLREAWRAYMASGNHYTQWYQFNSTRVPLYTTGDADYGQLSISTVERRQRSFFVADLYLSNAAIRSYGQLFVDRTRREFPNSRNVTWQSVRNPYGNETEIIVTWYE